MAKQQTDAQAGIDIARLQVEQVNMEAWVRAFEADFKEFRRSQGEHNEAVTAQLHQIGLAVTRLDLRPAPPPPIPLPVDPRLAHATALLNLVGHWSGKGSRLLLLLTTLWIFKVVSCDVDTSKLNAALDTYGKLGKAGLLPDATPATKPGTEALADIPRTPQTHP